MGGLGRLWLVGGIDPTGGAGLTRDRITAQICLPGVSVRAVVTADTIQGDGQPARSMPRPGVQVRDALAEVGPHDVVKLGLVPVMHVQQDLLEQLSRARAVVVDPVLRASDGGELGASASSARALAQVATLLTPNVPEAMALTGAHENIEASQLVARLHAVLGDTSFLLKGGHAGDREQVVDHLWHAGLDHQIIRARKPGGDPRGTGCALATAIACGVLAGADMVDAVVDAVEWLDQVRCAGRMGPGGKLHLPEVGPRLGAVRRTSVVRTSAP